MDCHQPSRVRFWLFLGAAILIVGLPLNPWTVPEFLIAAQFSYPSKRLWFAPINALALVAGIALIRHRQLLAQKLFVGRSGRLLASLVAISGLMAYACLECGSLFAPPAPLDSGITYMYRDHYLFSPAPQSSAGTTFTDYYSARHVPGNAPMETADQTIWFFGGSTMQDVVVRDEETIVRHAVRTLAEKGISAHAKNFGTVRFSSSMELVKLTDLLRRIPKSEHPDIAVFYDGYNDGCHGVTAGGGNLEAPLAAQLRMLIEGQAEKMLIYSAIRVAAKYSPFCARIALPKIQTRLFFKFVPKDLYRKNARESAAIYVANTEMIRTLCEKQFGIRCLFILQPMTFTRDPSARVKNSLYQTPEIYRRAYVDFYDAVRDQMRGKPDFVDASGIFDQIEGEVYVDLGHTNAKGSQCAGEFIGHELVRFIGLNAGSSSKLSMRAATGRIAVESTGPHGQ